MSEPTETIEPTPDEEMSETQAIVAQGISTQRRVLRALGIALLVSLALFLVLAVPTFRGLQEKARRVNCQGNLKCFGLALLMYSGDNQGFFPPTTDLQIMVDEGVSSETAGVWACPSALVKGTTVTTSNYIYIGSGLKDNNLSATSVPIYYDTPTNHDGKWINVLFIDGHTEGVKAATLEEAAAMRGWTLPPAATGVSDSQVVSP